MPKPSSEVLEQAVKALEVGLDEHRDYPYLLTVRDGVIQRFEVAMDLAWKLMQRTLKEVYGVDSATIRAKSDIFREAEKNGLIADAEVWINHYEARNQTSHIYDAKQAEGVFEEVPRFLPDVRDFLKRLSRVD